jgi:hypothetical protein
MGELPGVPSVMGSLNVAFGPSCEIFRKVTP